MSEPFKVYTASIEYHGGVVISEYEVVRETSKFYWIKTKYYQDGEQTAKSSGYQTYCKTKQEAVDALYAIQYKRVEGLRLNLEREEVRLESARIACESVKDEN
jgi:hypothetical protein